MELPHINQLNSEPTAVECNNDEDKSHSDECIVHLNQSIKSLPLPLQKNHSPHPEQVLFTLDAESVQSKYRFFKWVQSIQNTLKLCPLN